MTSIIALLTTIAFYIYILTALLYAGMWKKTSTILRVLAPFGMGLGLAVNICQLLLRWFDANQPPFKTLFESLILLAACIAIVYLVVELIYRARILGLPSAAGCAFTMLYAVLREDKAAVNLPPALQSGWFIPHVVVYFFGYAAIFVGAAAALLYLIRPKPLQLNRSDLLAGKNIDLEQLLNSAIRFGFALLTLGLLVGSVWAKAAWGDYWGWDPKETWSLVSWLIFAIYLHLHYLSKWRGRRLAILVLAGFAAVMFTYLGMNLLPTAAQSAHVYQ